MNTIEANTIKTPMEQVDELKYWLATAPCNWESDQNIKRYLLPTGEYISCILWNSLYHITGTDIVRSLVFRFQAFGRPVRNIKKFEEGIFSDLRNLKPGMDASLEEPKSEFLEMLYKNNCIRTQKKQKVFYWFSVPHDRLFLDALERDLKREKMVIEPTTYAVAEPALSFSFDSTQSLYDQFTKGISPSSSAPSSPRLNGLVYDPASISSLAPTSMMCPPIKTDDPSGVLYPLNQESQTVQTNASLGTFALFHSMSTCDNTLSKSHHLYSSPDLGYCSMDELSKSPFANTNTATVESTVSSPSDYFAVSSSNWNTPNLEEQHQQQQQHHHYDDSRHSSPDNLDAAHLSSLSHTMVSSSGSAVAAYAQNSAANAANLFGMFSLFEGSPTYKQRRRRANSCNSVNVNNNNLNGTNPNSSPRANAAPYSLKTYTCSFATCGRLFKRLEHLKRHVRTHTMERPYSCQVCGKRFSRSDNLAQHRKTHERGMNNSPTPSDDGSNSDLGYDDVVVVNNNSPVNNDCYTYEATNVPTVADLTSSCVPEGLVTSVYHCNEQPTTTYNHPHLHHHHQHHHQTPYFGLTSPFLEASVGNGILV
ncbi:hypothetical protein G9A89_010813 [Geosiphon pyriformis]|nr:hypothetical protein G9A89_010813 [Geosiphon pyriformis]